MIYITFIFDLIYNIMNNIYIPIPFSKDLIFNFSIFQLLIALFFISLLIYLIVRITKYQSDIFKNDVKPMIYKSNNYTIKKEKRS